MDDIAERAGVSKPVLYQHFPGKLDLYLALLDSLLRHDHRQLPRGPGVHRTTTSSASRRRWTSFYEYVAGDTGAFRLVFESDLTNEPAVREQRRPGHHRVRRDDRRTSSTRTPACPTSSPGCWRCPWWEWPRSARGSGCPRPASIEPASDAAALVAGLAWRGIRGYPLTDEH